MKWLNSIIYYLNDAAQNAASGVNKTADENATIGPIYQFLDTFGPALIGMLVGVGALYCIILGVQYAKAEKGDDRDVAKKKAINAAVSFVVIIILVVLLYGFRDTFVSLLSE